METLLTILIGGGLTITTLAAVAATVYFVVSITKEWY